MVQGYYTLEEAARILDLSQDKLNQMAQKREIRAFADRGTWRFRTQDIEEMARRMGKGSSPDLQLGEARPSRGPATPSPRPSPRPGTSPRPGASPRPGTSPRPGASPAPRPPDEVFSFDLGASSGDGGQDIIVDIPSNRVTGGKSSSRGSPSPKAGSDSDVKLVPDGSDVDFRIAPDSDVRLEEPKPGSGKPASSKKRPGEGAPSSGSRRRTGGAPGADAGVRLIPMDEGPTEPSKTPADSDIRIEAPARPAPAGAQRGDHPIPTEEIDLDAELRRAEKAAQARPRVRPTTPRTSDFELAPAGSSKDDPTALEIPIQGEDQVNLDSPPRDLTSSGVDSGINLSSPADSGIDLEKAGGNAGDHVEFELSLDDVPATPKPVQAADDSSSEFELALDDPAASRIAGEGEHQEDSSSEFELSLDVEGTPPPVAAREDSSSEFELTLEDSGGPGASVVSEGPDKDIFETDFEVPAMEGEAAASGESDTAMEGSDFDLSLVDEGGSQVVALDEGDQADESSDTIARSAILDDEAAGEVDELLEDDLGGVATSEEEDLAAAEEPAFALAPAAAPADWGIVPAIFLVPCALVMFLVAAMSFELLHGMWGYRQPTSASGALVKWMAKTLNQPVHD